MGVCCIVFDIDGMLFEFVMNFLNFEKNNILRILFLNISCFILFPTSKKKVGVKKIEKFAGGSTIFFFRKTILSHFISRYIIFSTLKKMEILKSAPSLTG